MIVRPLPDEAMTLRLRHRLHVRHATTHHPIAVDARLVQALPAGWVVDVRGADVLLKAWDGAPDPAGPLSVEVWIRDRGLADRLKVPPPDLDAEVIKPDAVVGLAAPEVVQEFVAAPAVIEVVLLEPGGDPATGRSVRARGSGGVLVDLNEDGHTGVYTSDPTVWSADLHPFELLVDGNPVQRIALDPARSSTRVRVIDPT